MVCPASRYSVENALASSLLEKREMMVLAHEFSPSVVKSFAFSASISAEQRLLHPSFASGNLVMVANKPS
jgi:hypothetical protein